MMHLMPVFQHASTTCHANTALVRGTQHLKPTSSVNGHTKMGPWHARRAIRHLSVWCQRPFYLPLSLLSFLIRDFAFIFLHVWFMRFSVRSVTYRHAYANLAGVLAMLLMPDGVVVRRETRCDLPMSLMRLYYYQPDPCRRPFFLARRTTK